MSSPLRSFLPARARVALSTLRLTASEVIAAPTATWRPVHTARHTADELRALTLAAAEARAARATGERGDEASVVDGRWLDVERLTSDSVHLTFERPAGFSFRPGQYVQIEIDVGGVRARRPYSLCSAPGADTLSIAVRRVDGGLVSNALVEGAAVGDPVRWTGPLGTFAAGCDLDADAALICVAGGSGITPILSVLRARLDTRPDAPTLLVFANRGYGSVMFRDALAALSSRSPGLTLEHVLERRSKRLGGHTGRVDVARLGQIVSDWLPSPPASARALLCGPDGLMDVAHDGLRAAGLDVDAIERERFAPATAAVSDAVGRTWSVSLPGYGVLVQVRDDQTILEAARDAGVPLKWSCGMGGCGACRMRLVSGDVVHDTPNCLSSGELSSGATLTCVARPRSPVELADD